ncbi:MAG: 6-carboxytetrahydropterin synthase [Bdellovibrionaceae bacterium]|nr:6-carboxytetrahydropterin synthase [Pseudobdellovibrionaceae bacterium]
MLAKNMEKSRGASFYLSSGYKSLPPLNLKVLPEKIYGQSWSPGGMGFNFLVEVTWSSEVCEPLPWKDWLLDWDHQFYNENVNFKNQTFTLELLNLKIFEDLRKKSGLKDINLKIHQGDNQYSRIVSDKYPQISWAKSYKFNSLHRHHNESLTNEENEKLFRKCSQIHGHEYTLTVEGESEIEASTGVVFWHSILDDAVMKEVIQPFHGHIINDFIGNTSGETLLQHIEKQLKSVLPHSICWSFFLKETKRNSFAIIS